MFHFHSLPKGLSLKILGRSFTNYIIIRVRLESTCKPREGLGLFASLFASQLSFQLSTLSSLIGTH